MLRDCQISSPPSREVFNAAPIDQKLTLTGEVYQQQTGNLVSCNAQLHSLRQWKHRMQLHFDDIQEQEDDEDMIAPVRAPR